MGVELAPPGIMQQVQRYDFVPTDAKLYTIHTIFH